MLGGRLIVHGADRERLARSAIRDSGLRLSWDREEELLAELLLVAWQLSEKHDERRYPGGLAKGCYQRLRFRVIDWVRKTEGRSRWQFSAEGAERLGRRHTRTLEQNGNVSIVVEHQRPTTLSLDAPVGEIVTPAWEKLSQEGAWTALEIASRISFGLSISETARQVGMRPKEVKERLDELADELMRVSEVVAPTGDVAGGKE